MTAATSWPHCSSGMPTTAGGAPVLAGDLVAADVHVADPAGRQHGSVDRPDLRFDAGQELADGAQPGLGDRGAGERGPDAAMSSSVTMFNPQSDAGSGLAVLSVSARPSAAGTAVPGLVQSSSSPVGSSM
jgi:hypothetical protein